MNDLSQCNSNAKKNPNGLVQLNLTQNGLEEEENSLDRHNCTEETW